jgi:hypothetical protein
LRLATLQTRRITRALADLEPHTRADVRRFLLAMIDRDRREEVLHLIDGASATPRRGA